jgi:two-component sensor histidine kinase
MSEKSELDAKQAGKKPRGKAPGGGRSPGVMSLRIGGGLVALSALAVAVNYLFLFEWVPAEQVIGRFLPTGQEDMKLRALIHVSPFVTGVLGYLLYRRGKIIGRPTGEAVRDAHRLAGQGHTLLGSILEYHSGEMPDERSADILRGDLRRMRAVALFHELISKGEGAGLRSAEYLRRVSRETADAIAPDRARILMDLDPVRLKPSTALACGMILSELVSNCLRFAFVDVERPEMHVYFGRGGRGMAELRVSDNGIGMPTKMDVKKLSTVGLKIVQRLAGQLKGKVDTKVSGGTTVRVRFPL